MRLLTDENIARSTVILLRSMGHDVEDVKEMNLSGSTDQAIAKLAKRQKRIIVSLDKDFGNVLVYPPHLQQGIILIDVQSPNPKTVNNLLANFLKNKRDDFFWNKLIILDEWRARVRE